MENDKHVLHFFLGANTPQGFVSRFDQLADPKEGWRKFILKGGPGTGKSSLMKRLAGELSKHNGRMELIHCPSDVDSLDAVIAPDIKAAIADGTAPHVIEPEFPGAYESVVELSGCWEEEALQEQRAKIMGLCAQSTCCRERCFRFLGAACSLLNDSARLASEYVDTAKVARYAARLARKEFPLHKQARGKETVRFLSAITPKGISVFTGTPHALCERIYLVEDDYGAVSRLLMNALRANALAAGLDIISCYCISSPFEKLEHLLIPELGLGFLTANRYHPFEGDYYRRIHARRFTDVEGLRSKRQRFSFNRKAVAELLGEACRLMGEAKDLHDEIERCYQPHVDFKRIDAITGEVIRKFLSLYS